MAIDKRLKIYEAISGSTIHQSISTASSQAALSRCQANQVKDPSSALETLRNLIQPEINLRIQKILADIADSHIKPAIRNLRINLGDENVPSSVLEDMCVNALEAAKKIYMHNNATQHVTNNVTVNVKRQQPQLSSVNNNGVNTVNNVTKNANTTLISNTNTGILRGKCPNQVLKRSFSGSSHHSSSMPKKSMIIKSGLGRPNTDLILVNKAGRPVRREGPKWEPKRLSPDTLFILGSRANKALGFGQTRGRLYIKHPELFKYSGDQTDKEWLAKANLMATTGGKAYLMVLKDILDLAESPEYSSHPKQQPGELVGFTVPDWMLEKMKAYIETAKTNPETTDEELLRMAEEYAEMEEEGKMVIVRRPENLQDESKKFMSNCPSTSSTSHTPAVIKKEEGEISLEGLMQDDDHHHSSATNHVANLFNDIKHDPDIKMFSDMKHEAVDDDLQNLDPGFLQGMNLHNLVREFEMDTGNGSELNLLALADDSLQ